MNSQLRMAAIWLTLLAPLCAVTSALAVVPGEMNYQGLLLDDQGAPVNGNVDLTFALFDVDVGGTALWTETHLSVPVLDGVYDVVLGETTPITPSLVAGGSLYLEISVAGETLTPRQKLAAVPYALRSETAEDAGAVGGVSSTFVTELYQNFPFDGADPPNDDPSEGFGDPDSDGLVNFLDPDNDDDGLSDADEVIAGSDINLVTPTLSGFNPPTADASSVSTVTVTGTNFESGMTVVFGSQTPTPQNLTATSFQVEVGPQPSGLVTVSVTRLNAETATAGFNFTESPSGLTGSTATDCGTGSAGSVTSCEIAYPAGVTAGDELLIWLGIDGNPDGIACTNFEHLAEQGGSVTLAVFRRTATAAHSGTEICSWDVAAPQAGGAIMTRVPPGSRLRPPLAELETPGTTSDPPAIPIPEVDALVIVACSHDGSIANVSDPPAGYTEALDGVGCDASGCANTSLATRVVTTAGFEDPGPFTNWSESEESACITLAFDGGSLPEPIFAVDWDGTSSPESCFAEGATFDSGTADCNCTTGNCPLPQGGESLYLPAQTSQLFQAVGYSSPNGSMRGTSQGCLIVDFEMNVDTFSSTSNTTFFELKSANSVSGGQIKYVNAGDLMGIRCGDNTQGAATFNLTEDTNYRVRLEYCIDGGPGNCAGNTAGCVDCGCLYVETAAGGNPYGTTQVDRCEGSSGTPWIPIDGWQFSMGEGSLDLVVDDLAVCDTPPPAGVKCGE